MLSQQLLLCPCNRRRDETDPSHDLARLAGYALPRVHLSVSLSVCSRCRLLVNIRLQVASSGNNAAGNLRGTLRIFFPRPHAPYRVFLTPYLSPSKGRERKNNGFCRKNAPVSHALCDRKIHNNISNFLLCNFVSVKMAFFKKPPNGSPACQSQPKIRRR